MKKGRLKNGKQLLAVLLSAVLAAGSMYMPAAAEEWDLQQEEAGFSTEDSLDPEGWGNDIQFTESEEEDETGTTAADGQLTGENEAVTEVDTQQGDGIESDPAQPTDPAQAPEENVQDSGDAAQEDSVSNGFEEEAREEIGNAAQESDIPADPGETKELIGETAQEAEIPAASDEEAKEEIEVAGEKTDIPAGQKENKEKNEVTEEEPLIPSDMEEAQAEIREEPAEEEETALESAAAAVEAEIIPEHAPAAAQLEDGTDPHAVEEAEIEETVSETAHGTVIDSGIVTSGITWKLSDQNVLTISGYGPIPDFETYEVEGNESYSTTAPWDDHWEAIWHVIIEDGITRIGANSFSGYENLSTVSLPESLTEIGDYAFTFCSFLEEVTLPDSLDTIGKGAFSFSALVEIEIPDGVETISEEAFYYCQDLEWLHLGESVRTIQKKAFACCEVLETVSLPEYIERIGTKAFANCECLNDILIDINVSFIAPDAFEGSENVLIYCFDESYAMKYAIREKILFSVIPPASVARVTVTGLSAKTYTGSALTQSPIVSLGDTELEKGTDYTLSYKNNINAGTATMTVTGKGDYYGSVSRTFTIKPASITKATVTCPASKVWAGWALTPVPTVKVGSRTLKKGTDFSLSFKNNVHVGKATITITGKGNYTGTYKKTFSIIPKPTTISSISSAKKKLTVKWKKQPSETTGYQIQYSSRSDFKTQKTVTVTGVKTVSKALTGLAGKHKYYVRIRPFKTISGTKYFAAWSAAKSAKTK